MLKIQLTDGVLKSINLTVDFTEKRLLSLLLGAKLIWCSSQWRSLFYFNFWKGITIFFLISSKQKNSTNLPTCFKNHSSVFCLLQFFHLERQLPPVFQDSPPLVAIVKIKISTLTFFICYHAASVWRPLGATIYNKVKGYFGKFWYNI